MEPIIVVHGGAGQWNSDQLLQAATKVCKVAAKAGQDLLLAGASAVDAVEAAVRVLEESPILDAGRGSYLNQSGEIELDALIMDGASLRLGAIASVQRILHPISLARRLMIDSRHNLLVGPGAEAFAEEIGFPRCRFEDLLAADSGRQLTPVSSPESAAMVDGDTVGAVALDIQGNVASATSTGGTKDKHSGRVGDSPLVGSGGYADNWSAAVSATGQGEALMRIVISKTVCDLVATGLSAQGACEAAIRILEERTDGQGGLIAVDIRGGIGIAFNTEGMPYAHIIGRNPIAYGP
ncbi:MAG: isoaspartyl peptidase/L-asparaginase [Chloroflexota bacterium]|jgi:beta-aspartyl-peptidase (threonine type)